MKVLEAQNALLTNYEVFHHLSNNPMGSRRVGKRGPKTFETLHREIIQYFTTMPSPLAQKPITYSEGCIKELIQKLNPYDLSKGEMIMLFNNRPASAAALSTIVEEMETRFDDTQQQEIVDTISQVLGVFPPEEEGEPAEEGQDAEDEGEGEGEGEAVKAES